MPQFIRFSGPLGSVTLSGGPLRGWGASGYAAPVPHRTLRGQTAAGAPLRCPIVSVYPKDLATWIVAVTGLDEADVSAKMPY